mgnify:CR=1 FL=1
MFVLLLLKKTGFSSALGGLDVVSLGLADVCYAWIICCLKASVFSLSTTGTTTFSFTNVPSISNTALGLTLEVTAGGTHTLNWPASVKWAGGTAPDAPASGETNIYGFYTRNAGTTWYGFLSGAAMA